MKTKGLFLSVVLSLLLSVPAFGADTDMDVSTTEGFYATDSISTNEAQNQMVLSNSAVRASLDDVDDFKVIVPLVLHVEMDSKAHMTYRNAMGENMSGTAKIINESGSGTVTVSDVKIVTSEDWTISEWSSDFGNMQVDTKTLGFMVNGLTASVDGTILSYNTPTDSVNSVLSEGKAYNGPAVIAACFGDFDKIEYSDGKNHSPFPIIQHYSALPIDYAAKLPAVSERVSDTELGTVIFTVDFKMDAKPTITWLTRNYNNGLEIIGYEVENGIITEVEVPEEIDGKTILSIGASVFENETMFFDITLPSTIENIGADAFKNCVNAVVRVNSDVYQADGFKTFGNVKELHVKTLTPGLAIDGVIDAIGEGIPTYVDGELFVNENGAVVKLADKTSERWYMCVTEDREAIDLSSLSDWKASSPYNPMVIPADGNVAYPMFVNGKLVTEIPSSLYSSNNNILSIEFPSSITSIGSSAFNGCTGLTGDLVIPNSVTSIGSSAFRNCSGFTGNLVISDSVTSIGNSAFYNCSGFTGNLVIPDSVTSIGNSAFYGCSGFKGSLTIGKSVTSIGTYAFYNCSGLTGNLIIPEKVTSIGNYAFYGCKGFNGTLTIGENVKTIGAYAFYNCSGFTGDLIIPDSVTSFAKSTGWSSLNGITYYPSSAFYGCSGFNGILSIGNGLTEIGGAAFYGCKGLTGDLVIPNGVTFIDCSAFYNCSGLNGTLTIPNSVTEIVGYAFANCSGLTGDLIIPDGVTYIGDGTFENCKSLNGNLVIPNNVTSIGGRAFNNCYGLVGDLIIPSGVTKIGQSAFYACRGLTGEVVIPDNMTSIENITFFDCEKITSIIIPDSITSIGKQVFWACYKLETIVVPSSVTTIGEDAFASAKTVYYRGDAEGSPWGAKQVIDVYPWEEELQALEDLEEAEGLEESDGLEESEKSEEVDSTETPSDEATEEPKEDPQNPPQEDPSQEDPSTEEPSQQEPEQTEPEQTVPEQQDPPEDNTEQEEPSISFITEEYDDGLEITGIEIKGTITEVEIPAEIDGKTVLSIGDGVFADQADLVKVTLPSTIKNIGEKAFYNCTAIESLYIPYSVKTIGEEAFTGIEIVYYNGTAEGEPWGAEEIESYEEEIDGEKSEGIDVPSEKPKEESMDNSKDTPSQEPKQEPFDKPHEDTEDSKEELTEDSEDSPSDAPTEDSEDSPSDAPTEDSETTSSEEPSEATTEVPNGILMEQLIKEEPKEPAEEAKQESEEPSEETAEETTEG